jgi:hypothetical protein
MDNTYGTRKIYTTAPKSLDRVEGADKGVIGKHTIGYQVREIEVPAGEFHDQIADCWKAQHMAITAEELLEMVGKGLIQLETA